MSELAESRQESERVDPIARALAGTERTGTTPWSWIAAVDAVPDVVASVVGVVGAVVLLGWVAGVSWVARLFPGLPKMTAATALCLVGGALGLWLLHHGRRAAAAVPTALVGAMGILTVTEYLASRSFALDLLPHDPGTVGRPPFNSAVTCIVLAGSLLTVAHRRGDVRRLGRLLATAAGLLALVSLAGRAYGVAYIDRVEHLGSQPLAAHAAAAFLLLALGALCIRRDEGLARILLDRGPAGIVMRWMLVIAVVAPIGMSGLAVLAVRTDVLGAPTALLVMAGLTVAVILAVGRQLAVTLRAADERRQEAESVALAEKERYEQAYERERKLSARLRASDQMKTTFLHAVSHELRTPLTVIDGFAEMIATHDDTVSAATVKEWAGRIGTNSRRLQALLGDLLDLDRFTRGAVQARRHPTDVGTLVRLVLADLDTGSHPVHTSVDVGTAIIDAAQVERIVENLILNAVRHTPAGTPIWVAATKDADGGIQLVVDDAGPGIADELKEAIFEPFRQGGAEVAPRGTGIGLSLVAGFADLHNGRAWVQDRPGGGASFHVTLAPWAGRGRRVLVVDWDGKCHLCETTSDTFEIARCAGPGNAPMLDHCPQIAEGVCDQAKTADAIVLSLSPSVGAASLQLEIAQAYRKSYPRIPVILEVPEANVAEYAHFDGCHVVAAPITEADLARIVAPEPSRRPRLTAF